MTDQHPIQTPPMSSIREWAQNIPSELWGKNPDGLQCSDFETERLWQRIARYAAQWGADQELEACTQWIYDYKRESVSLKEAANKMKSKRRFKTKEEIKSNSADLETYKAAILDLYGKLDKLKTQHENHWCRIVKLEDTIDVIENNKILKQQYDDAECAFVPGLNTIDDCANQIDWSFYFSKLNWNPSKDELNAMAAVINAAANQVVPDEGDVWKQKLRGDAWIRWDERKLIRSQLLNIANQLKNNCSTIKQED